MPSTFECEVVQITSMEKHPNADSLSITKVYDYPVIIRTEDWTLGDLAVYFPVESVLPEKPCFSFLWKNKENPTEKQRMIRAIRLRGIFSMGLLIPLTQILADFPELTYDLLKVGDDLSSQLKVYKYEPPDPINSGGDNRKEPHWMPKYTDIENVRKYGHYLKIGEAVVITEKIHGCLASHTKIRMADGSTKKITQVQVGDSVLGMNSNKQVVPTLVINTFNNGKCDKWLKVVTERCAAGRGNSYATIYCTPNHKFWCVTRNKYIQAQNLSTDDYVLVARSDLFLNPVQEQILLGKILGDGYLHVSKNTAAIEFGHTIKHDKYIEWTHSGLGSISKNIHKCVSGYGTNMQQASTIYSWFIKNKFESFYKNGKKIIPKWVIDSITPIALAFWYMDDGSLGHHEDQEDRAHFAVCNFTEEDCDTLLLGLKRFNIIGTYYKSQKYSRIRLNADEAEKLFLLIAPYIPKCMQYKLPERYRGHNGWIPSHDNQYKSTTIPQKILSIEDTTDKIKSNRYDIETETHNFFCPDVLVHNSNARFCYKTPENELFVGSHNMIKAPDGKDNWNTIAQKLELEEKLQKYPNHVFFGEVYGPVQKGFRYDSNGKLSLVIFDIFDIESGKYLDL